MKTCSAALAIVKKYEGFSATPYLCPARVWTIGYGSTRTPDGQPVTAETPAIDEGTAAEWMTADIEDIERQVSRLVNVPVTENQFGALVSFTYNLGSGRLQGSTLRLRLNRGDYEGAQAEFWKWRRSGGQILRGLVLRREEETALFGLA